MGRLLLAIGLLLACGSSSSAQTAGPELEQYRAGALEYRTTFFLSTEIVRIYRGGLLIDEDYDVLFANSPDALGHVAQYETLHLSGALVGILGLGVAVAGFILAVPDDNEVLGLTLVIGGLATMGLSSWLVALGRSHLNDAVHVYNRDLYRRIREARGSR